MPLVIGQTLHNNRYRIVKLIGQGGFGAVYRAWDLTLNQPVALKENLDASLEAQQQFEREARLMAGLRHPNLPRVIDHFFVPGQGQYLVMDFVEGRNLAALLTAQGRPFTEAEALPWLEQVCAALDYLHTRQPPIIHRDIKPENIIITPEGQAMLVDFGISKIYDPQLSTTVGARAVTPGYSPPEQYGAGKTDARTDVYALGATLYRLLTGQEPPPSVDIVSGVSPLMPPRQVNQQLSLAAEQAVLLAMSINVSQRFTQASQLLATMTPAVTTQLVTPLPLSPRGVPLTPTKRPVWWVVGGMAGLLMLILAFSLGRGQNNGVAAVPTTPTPGVGRTRIAPTDGMVQVYVPAGEFTMGSEDGDYDEKPVHTVYLDAYWLDQTEVSNAQFAQFVAATGHQTTAEQEGGGYTYTTDGWNYTPGANWQRPQGPGSNLNGLDNHPVVLVSWPDATAYCEWAGRRLPTEAEWEKAARGTDERVYPWGNTFDGNRLNYCDANCPFDTWKDGNVDDGYQFTAPVGSYPSGASPYGALDMAGNVWEWVADWYDERYYARSPARNPTGPTSGDFMVLRGGSWRDNRYNLRCATRGGNAPDVRFHDFGFRCASTPF